MKQERKTTVNATPVSEAERIHLLDAIRGFGLIGIFLVNMPTFLHPVLFLPQDGLPYDYSRSDEWVRLLFNMFVQTKFYTIFSFLFGTGFFLFMKRAEEKALPMRRLFTRRLTVLLIFGLAHIAFFWYGDILHTYALTGFILLLFYRISEKTVRRWAWSLLIVMQLLYGITLFIPADPSMQGIKGSPALVQTAIDVYNTGTWMEWMQFRFTHEFPILVANEFFAVLSVLPLFLFGYSVARMGVLANPSEYRKSIKRVWWWTLLASIPLVGMIPMLQGGIVTLPAHASLATMVFVGWSGLTLCGFYICSFLLLFENNRWRKLLSHLEPLGRMALSNYLTQTILSVVLVRCFQIYGSASLATGLFICLVILALQVVSSRWWLSRYRFGPVEWVWRCLTYAKRVPMKRNGGTRKTSG